MSIVLIAPPACEPVTVPQLMKQMGYGLVADGTLQATLQTQLSTYLLTARRVLESHLRRAFITQRWLYQFDGFCSHKIMLPVPPLQSIDWFKYVDVSGLVQTLLLDLTYGSNPPGQVYGYQMNRGSETEPGSVSPPWARPWPPTRLVQNSVLIQMRVGYGQPFTATMAANSAVLTADVKFNPDDAPGLTGDTGLPISIPGAGSGGLEGPPLNTFIASVDGSGNATLATAATTAVAGVGGWAGNPVPGEIVNAMLLLAQWYYEQGSVSSDDIPEHILCMVKPYRNLVA